MLSEKEKVFVKKYWTEFQNLSRNGKANLITGIGVLFLAIGMVITSQLPDSIAPVYTPNQEYLVMVRVLTTILAGCFVFVGLTMLTIRVTCPHCQKKV